MNDPTLPLTGLSSVGGKAVVARFDGGMLSSNGGVLALAEVEKRLRVADRLARCIDDPRCPDQVVHSLADMIGFRMKMIAAGYEDGNDANRLRSDPIFKMAQDGLPSGRDLASQSTMCRLENLPGVRELVAMGRAMVDLYCASFGQVPKRIVLDIDDTFDAVHGGQQLRLFNAHHDEYGFQPIVVFDGAGRFVSAILRPAQAAEWGRNPPPPATPGAGDPEQLAEHPDPDPGRQPLLQPAGHRLVPRQPCRLHLRSRAHHHIAQACRGPGNQHDDAF